MGTEIEKRNNPYLPTKESKLVPYFFFFHLRSTVRISLTKLNLGHLFFLEFYLVHFCGSFRSKSFTLFFFFPFLSTSTRRYGLDQLVTKWIGIERKERDREKCIVKYDMTCEWEEQEAEIKVLYHILLNCHSLSRS